MTSFLAVFVAAVPFVFWLVRRRAKPPQEKKDWQRELDADSGFVATGFPDLPASAPVARFAAEADIPETNENAKAKAEAETEIELLPLEAHAEDQDRDVPEVSSTENDRFHSDGVSYSSGLITEDQIKASRPPLAASPSEILPTTPNDGTADKVESKSAVKISEIDVERLLEGPIAKAINGTPQPANGFAAELAAPVALGSPAVGQSPEVLPPETLDNMIPAPLVSETEEPGADEKPEAALLYRAPRQGPPRSPQQQQANQQVTTRSASSDAPLDIQVGLTFDRFGFCSIVLLPKRTSDLDDEVEARDGRSVVPLVAQDNWYQDLQYDDVADKLRHGFELRGRLKDHRHMRWRLSGRTFYVLATHPRTNKFVSTHRLHVGRPDVVLCTAEMLREVETVLAAAGCQGYTRFDESYGAPPGWVGLRGVLPTRALPLDQGVDPLYALKPESDVQIELEGGVCLRNSVWLAGYPPQIKIFGEHDLPLTVLIDGRHSQQIGDGVFAVEGYDQPGQHSVYCEGLSLSRTYSIEEGPESWEEWPAYKFGQADICGPLVELKDQAAAQRPFAVPMSNPLLIGAEPGQVYRCSLRKARFWKGFVPFDVVWALPAQPLICNKKTARILQFGDVQPKPLKTGVSGQWIWSNAILDASRKGLQIENPSDASIAYWREYRKAARDIRRGRR